MNYNELMIKSLTDLLKVGESLYHPIYGVLKQGNTQHYGFFGFTENYLLIALVSGKQITYTIRVPLDIKSIQIKQKIIFRQYIIDICFNDGAPCRIVASPKVFLVDSQSENLPSFLNYLKNKSPVIQSTKLNNVQGNKIRRQYFNEIIYTILAYSPMLIVMPIVIGLKENNLNLQFQTIMESVVEVLTIWLCILSPFLVLSLFNRFFFGKIISVVNDEGLVLENNFIKWKDVKEITYEPYPFYHYKYNTSANVLVKPLNKKEYTLDILHFPFYGLRIIKKQNSNVKVKIGKKMLFSYLVFFLFPTVLSIILPLFM